MNDPKRITDRLDELSRMNSELVTLQRQLIRKNAKLSEMQEELSAGKERYRKLLSVVPQLIWTCDRDGDCSFVGGEWHLYAEEEEKEPAWTNWFEAVVEEDKGRVLRTWRTAVEENVAFDVEHRILTRRRGVRWFKTRGVELEVEEGDDPSWVLSSTDITDLIETRDALAAEQLKLQAVLETREETERLANMRAQIALNLARDEKLNGILQQTAEIICDELGAALVRIWVLPRDRKDLRLRASAGLYTHLDGDHGRIPVGSLKIGRIAESNQPHISNDVTNDPEVGDPDWAKREGLVSFAGFPLIVEERVVGVIALFSRRPVSDRLVPELSLISDGLAQFIDRKRIDRERRRKVRDLVRAREEIETLNRIGQQLSAELDMERLAHEVVEAATLLTGAGFGAFFYDVVTDEMMEAYGLYAVAGGPRSMVGDLPESGGDSLFGPLLDEEGVILSRDITTDPLYSERLFRRNPSNGGTIRSYLAVPVRSARSGEVIGGLFFGHTDVGVFSESESTIVSSLASQASIALDNARIFSRLEQKVQERTARLQESIGELEAFSYTVSHDLRAPLRVMQSYSQIIREDFGDTLDPTALHYLERIAGAASRLDHLIQDLLTYSRMSRANMRMSPIALEPIIEDVLTGYPVFKESEADVIIKGPLPRVIGDRSSLTQCFSNLIGNAVKFVPEGKRPVITIAGEVEAEGVIVTVSDNGIGIPEEHMEKIFRIFERATAGGAYEGTGIGLAIVRKAMERMGGSVTVSSVEGEGSTFALRFLRPRSSGSAAEENEQDRI